MKASVSSLLITFFMSSLLLGSVSFTLGDDRYDYDQCARRCSEKPAHERQICVTACSRHHPPEERPFDPRHPIEQCQRRCESQETEERHCRKRCEELFGDKGQEPDVINAIRDAEDQFEQQCELRCVSKISEKKELHCHQRCLQLAKEKKQCERSCQMEGRGDQEQCQKTCRQQLEEQERKRQEQIGSGGEKRTDRDACTYVLEGLNVHVEK